MKGISIERDYTQTLSRFVRDMTTFNESFVEKLDELRLENERLKWEAEKAEERFSISQGENEKLKEDLECWQNAAQYHESKLKEAEAILDEYIGNELVFSVHAFIAERESVEADYKAAIASGWPLRLDGVVWNEADVYTKSWLVKRKDFVPYKEETSTETTAEAV